MVSAPAGGHALLAGQGCHVAPRCPTATRQPPLPRLGGTSNLCLGLLRAGPWCPGHAGQSDARVLPTHVQPREQHACTQPASHAVSAACQSLSSSAAGARGTYSISALLHPDFFHPSSTEASGLGTGF